MKKIKNIIIKHKKISLIILLIAVILLAVLSGSAIVINKNKNEIKKEENSEFSWEVYDFSGKTVYIETIFKNETGIKKVIYPEDETTKETFEVYPNGRNQIAIDLKLQDRVSYEFKIVTMSGEEKIYTLDCEIPRQNGEYVLVNGIYVNKPDVSTGFEPTKTRYMYLNDDGALVPGNWITDDAPEKWFDYNSQNWANIYVENNGIEGYYVWIPRYVYKLDTTNQRTDIKFINTYNEYIDALTGKLTTWDELKEQGYQLPEAFTWKYKQTSMNLVIPGYWLSKHQLSTLSSYTINYNMVATTSSFNVSGFTTNTTKTIGKCTYAINGKIAHESETLENYSFENATPDITNVVNVSILDTEGRIIGSMTKELELTQANEPDLTGFNPETTYYVYWDEDGTKHDDVPISEEPPANWYNYSYSVWANIVTKNNGAEAYFVWIPRYQCRLDSTSQKSDIKFIIGTGTAVDTEYSIPEAFTWNGKQITGYWISKYQLSN